MAEVAGLVLGAIPIVIWALEKYAEPVEVYTSYHNNIKTFRSDLMLQERRLQRTLSSIGLYNPTKDELRECLKSKFPTIADEVLHIIQDMERVMAELMRKLGIDLDTKVNAMPHTSWWEWRRVKNSVNTKRRRAVVDLLRERNTDLCRCLKIEKYEVQAEDDNPVVQNLIKCFSMSRCDALRLCLGSLHRALASSLRCACPVPHQAALDLDWHLYESTLPPDFNIAVSYQTVLNTQQSAPCWRKLHATPNYPAPANPATPKPAAPNTAAARSAPLSTSVHGSTNLSPVPRDSTAGRRALLRTPSPLRFIVNRTRFDEPDQPSLPLIPRSNISLATPTPPEPLPGTSLCDIVVSDTGEHVLQDHDEDHGRHFCLRHNSSNEAKIKRLVPIDSLHLLEGHKKLSLKARCGLAAYAAWSVLHLSSGPWLGDDWDGRHVGIFLETRANDGERFAEHPCFLYNLVTPPGGLPDSDGDGQGEASGLVRRGKLAEQDKQLVPNMTVFSLGILLVELCLGKSFTQDHHHHHQQQQQPSTPSTTITGRYASAMSNLDEVYMLAGTSYGDAAKKCIKFCFPGQDSHNTFEMVKFRAMFYRDVVAPVQATYSRILD